ncbi:MAG: ABC transporter substrate-binding protein, partial [Pseudomonadota bacterium]
MTKVKDQILLDRLADAARDGKISRRSFMHYAAVAGVTTTTATGLWTSSANAAPQQGGKYRMAQHDGNTSDQHDPGQYQSNFEISLTHTFRSYLTMINPDGSLGGDIASEWSATPDAKEWTFKINPNATFHDGAKVTTADVIASMNHHRGEASTSAAKALLAGVEEMVDNGDSVTFKLSAPTADLPWIMPDYHLAIVPANADGTANWQSGMGSGPYKIKDLEFGVGATLVRHDGWHGEGAYFD